MLLRWTGRGIQLADKMKFYMIIIMFLLIGAFFIISENNLAMKNEDSRVEFGNLYLSWVNQIIDNSKVLTGYIVKLDWLPENESAAG